MGLKRECFACEYKPDEDTKNVILHKFPRNKYFYDKWKTFCMAFLPYIVEEDNLSSKYLCSKHFQKSDYRSPTALKENAVPLIIAADPSDMDIEEQKKIEQFLRESNKKEEKKRADGLQNGPKSMSEISNGNELNSSETNVSEEAPPDGNHISETAFVEMCRCCVINKGQVNVFEAHFNGTPFVELIDYCTKEKISANDKLPKMICNLCMQLIISSYTFIKNMKSSQHHIKLLAKQLKLGIDKNNVAIQVDDVIDLCENEPPPDSFQHKFRNLRKIYKDLCDVLEENKKVIKRRSSARTKENKKGRGWELQEIVEAGNEDDDFIITKELSTDDQDNCQTVEVHSLPIEVMEKNIEDLLVADYDSVNITYDNEGSAQLETKKKEMKNVVCFECSENLETEQNLIKHCKETGHVMPDRYKCEICSATFLMKKHLSTHFKNHKYTMKRICEICGVEVQCTNLKRHLETHNSTISYPCERCGKTFTQRSSLNTHIKVQHLGEKGCLCFLCGKTFSNATFLNTHLNKEHEDEDLTSKYLSCKKCQKYFVTEKSMRLHRKCQHRVKRTPKILTKNGGTMKAKQCPTCLKFFKGNGLKVHIYRDHEGIRPYQCHVCEMNFLMPAQLKNHLLKHLGERAYKCPHCPKTFRWKRFFDNHMKKHGPKLNRTYVCSMCDKTFSHITLMRRHEQAHLETMNCTALLQTELEESDGRLDYFEC